MVATRARRILALPDLHVPYHDHNALACVLKACEIWDPDEIVVLGDWLDAAAFSRHGRASMAELRCHKFIDDEVAPTNSILDRLQGYRTGRSKRERRAKRKMAYLEGNHEQRIERWAADMGDQLGPEIYKMVSPERLIRHRVRSNGLPDTERANFKWIPYIGRGQHSHYVIAKRTTYCSPLIAVHGWSIARHAAAKHLDLGRSVSVVHGHTHRAQMVVSREPLGSNRLLYAWSPGCLAQLVPLYMANQPSDWTQGFSCIYVGRNSWTPYNIPIHRGGYAVLPDGREVRG